MMYRHDFADVSAPPRVEAMLRDPITRMLMESDGVEEDDVRTLCAAVSARLAEARAAATA
jgi:hypothetical protein